MTTRLLYAATIVLTFAVGFWLYGVARTMRETVFFNPAATASGMLLGVGVPVVGAVLCLIAKALWFRQRSWNPLLLVALAVSLSAGNAASEAWILWDEAGFWAEVASTDGPYSRARAWPNRAYRLIYMPGKGIHATD
jgi:hypothetical protein